MNSINLQVILVDRSERGHYLIKLISEKRKQEETMTLMETTDSVAVLQLEDPQGAKALTLCGAIALTLCGAIALTLCHDYLF